MDTLRYTYHFDLHNKEDLNFCKDSMGFPELEQSFHREYLIVRENLGFNACTVHFQIKSEGGSDVLAAYDPVRSKHGELVFIVNCSLLRSFKSGETLTTKPLLKNVLMHELVHALDTQTIKENYTEYDFARKLFLNIGTFACKEDKVLAKGDNFSVQWTFLNYLANMRNEGVAILGQKMLHNELFVDPNYQDIALLRFKKDLGMIVNMCLGHTYHQRLSGVEATAMIRAASKSIYEYADIVLQAILEQENPNMLQRSTRKNRLQDVFQRMIHMDLSEWINGMLHLKDPLTNECLIDKRTLFRYCSLLERKGEPVHADNLVRLAYNREKSHFVENIQSVFQFEPEPWTFQGKIDQLNQKHKSSDLVKDVRSLSQDLLRKRTSENSLVVDLALSYLFHENDIIRDDLSFIGLQDDWFVLDGASVLILNDTH